MGPFFIADKLNLVTLMVMVDIWESGRVGNRRLTKAESKDSAFFCAYRSQPCNSDGDG